MVDRGTAFLIALVTSLFVAIGVNFAFYYWIEPAIEKGREKEKISEVKHIEVPDLRGVFPQQAKLLLSQTGLSLVVEGEVESNGYPEGTIAEQTPMAGSLVSKGSSIFVKISKEKQTEKIEEVKIPPVMGLDLASAQRTLIERGFLVGEIKKISSEEIPEGHVVKTYPPAGSVAPKNSKVILYISSGMVLVRVPNLIGKYYHLADDILEKAGLKLGRVHKVLSAEHPVNKIIDQNPKPGVRIKKGSYVDITIATVREELY